MAKTDDRASHYVFVEDEDIFAEDEKRLASRRKESSSTTSPNVTVTESFKLSTSKKSNSATSRFHQDPAVVQRDLNKLRRAVKLLSTIPPPPSVTNPQFSLHEILNLWNNHNVGCEINKWRPGLREEALGHDVYLNTNNYVEELEHLRQRLNQRFVSNETASHLTYTAPPLTDHEKEVQRRNGMLKSASSHASSLSQRKVFYNQFSNSCVRTFVNDSKKAGFSKSYSESKISSKNATAYPALFNSPKRQISNSIQHVASNRSSAPSGYCSTMPPSNYSIPSAASSTSSSSSSSLVTSSSKKAGFSKSHSEKISSKNATAYTALFNSPKKQISNSTLHLASNRSIASSGYCSTMPPSNYSIPSAASSASSSPSSSLITSARSSGFVSLRSEKMVSTASRVVDSGNKQMVEKNKHEEQRISEKSGRKPKKLSHLHRKKMLWAVETLLKSESVINTDPEYKVLFANIYQETTQVWLKHCEKNENGRFKDSATGTSDLMVLVAKKVLPGVEQKLGLVCSAIRARKECTKKSQAINVHVLKSNSTQASNSTFSQTPCIGDTSEKKELNESSVSIVDDEVFSPEMLGVSNLCEGIDAVISSLDDLPPDPGDKSAVPNSKQLNSLSIKDILAIAKPDDVISENTNSKGSETSLQNTVMPTLSVVAVNSPLDALINNKNVSDIVTVSDTSVSCITDCPKKETLSSISGCVDVQNAQSSFLIDTTGDNHEQVPCNEASALKENNEGGSSTECPLVNDGVKNDIKEDIKETKVENNSDSSNIKRIPVCIVKLERSENIVTERENSVTPDKVSVSNVQLVDNAVSTPKNPLEKNSSRLSAKKINLEDRADDESPGQSSVESGRRRSKRKRASDVSSNENTPNSSCPKGQNSKRICSNSSSDLNEFETPTSYLRRSSRNKLSFDDESPLERNNKSKHDQSDNVTDSGEIVNRDAGEGSSTRTYDQHNEIDASRPDQNTSFVDIAHQGESSASNNRAVSPNNIDKENDSSMENISDVDNQNWSPILKLTRSSKDLWSSELKKKKIRRKKDNSENSPVSASFLDLEGPFKYRLCKRAQPGEFVSAVIKGETYIKSFKKLVKKKVITKDCVLVRTVEEGIELKIPLELLKKERIFFGPNGFQNMICDIVEDAICKLEGFESGKVFNGFTIHDINQAALTSCTMEKMLNVIEQTGEVVKPLFAMYKYAIVKKSPNNFKDFYKIFVEVLKTSLFLRKTVVEDDTIQVRPLKAESPIKVQLEINIPLHLIGKNIRFKENILKDLTPVHNIISC